MGDGVAGILARLVHHRLPGTVAVRAAEMGIDRALRTLGHAPDQRQIGAFEVAGTAMIGELLAEMAMGAVVLGDHHDAARILVEAMNDAGAADSAYARQAIATMIYKGIDQRSRPVAVAGVNDEPGGLVDHDEIVVLVENVEGMFSPCGSAGSGSGSTTAIFMPSRSLCFASRTGVPSTVTWPSAIRD